MVVADVAAPPGKRIAAIDVARGVAIVAMVIYHFSWDVWAFGLVSANVEGDRWWVLFARSIATTFLVLVGISLVLANPRGLRLQPYLRRLAMVAGGAVLVTIGTYVSDSSSFVYFGILHLIAVASVLAVPFLAAPLWLTAAVGIAVILLGNFYFSPVFDAPWLVWIGMAPRVPETVDYVPLFPWFGVVLLGIVTGRVLLASGRDSAWARWRPRDPVTRFLALAGQWSLVIYLVHQLVLYGGVTLAAQFLAPAQPAAQTTQPPASAAPADPATAFMNDCLPACVAGGKTASTCVAQCSCMLGGLNNAGLLSVAPSAFTDAQRTAFDSVTKQCVAPVVRPPGAL